ncbi:MAG: hypothetical protein G3H99_06145 [Ferrovum sp.]|nr:hypothetical protein [Ferrovum sp.]NDU88062.1 hypothetical protein [Ferrovum sp.]
MSALRQRHRYGEDPLTGLEEGLASIRRARSEIEAETVAYLDEQARLREDAQVREVPVDQLHQSRAEDLARLEMEHTQAERRAIAAIEQRMEVALRAIEADNARIFEEERATVMAGERLSRAQEAMALARTRQEEEGRLALQIRQRIEQEQAMLAQARQRIDAEQALAELARQKESAEKNLRLVVDEACGDMRWAIRVLDLQGQLHRTKHLLYGVVIGGLVMGGSVALYWGWQLGVVGFYGIKASFGLH